MSVPNSSEHALRSAVIATALAMNARKQKTGALLERISGTLARVGELEAGADPGWEAKAREIDREVAEIETLRMSL